MSQKWQCWDSYFSFMLSLQFFPFSWACDLCFPFGAYDLTKSYNVSCRMSCDLCFPFGSLWFGLSLQFVIWYDAICVIFWSLIFMLPYLICLDIILQIHAFTYLFFIMAWTCNLSYDMSLFFSYAMRYNLLTPWACYFNFVGSILMIAGIVVTT